MNLKRLQRDLDYENDSTNWSGSGNTDFQCKEEPDQYIPIIEISSVCSMATPSPAQVSSNTVSEGRPCESGQVISDQRCR